MVIVDTPVHAKVIAIQKCHVPMALPSKSTGDNAKPHILSSPTFSDRIDYPTELELAMCKQKLLDGKISLDY